MKALNLKTCTKPEFDAFLQAYPQPLTTHVVTICEPMKVTYNDFSQGHEYPHSIVAMTDEGYHEENCRLWGEPVTPAMYQILDLEP